MSDELQLDELDLLKQRADDMGVKYHPNISVEKLKTKIDAQLNKEVKDEVKQDVVISKAARRQAAIKDAEKLIRVRVTCMNQAKRDWPGEPFTVSNSLVGTIRKFVPFDGSEYHIPNFIYKVMKARKFRQIVEKPDGKGGKVAHNRFVPEFNIEVLKPLTQKELDQLAIEQAKRGSVEDE